MARKEAPAQTVKVTYNGPVGNHLVPSPTRRKPNYGMHTKGDVFEVYAGDQAAAPKLFILVEQPAEPVAEKNMQAPPAPLQDAERTTKVAVTDGETKEETGEKVTAKATTKATAKTAESKESK